jgi:hypothetical protein
MGYWQEENLERRMLNRREMNNIKKPLYHQLKERITL